MFKTARAWLLVILAFGPFGEAAMASDWYSARQARPPQGNRVYICHGYACRIVTPVQLTEAELKRIAAPLRARHADAASERQALSKSVQVFETIIGKRVGTANDLPGMQFGKGLDDQMDCLDEATNTTSLLRVLAARDALAHHAPAEPASRGFFLDGRYPHATAVIADTTSGTRWVVDSWPSANARPPLIVPLANWYKARRSPPPA